METFRNNYAIHYAIQLRIITQFIRQFITQLNYAEILKITRLRNGGNYAEIHQNYAMGNLLMVDAPAAAAAAAARLGPIAVGDS